MTFEEFNRAMEFIVQQQAEFSIKLDRDHEWAGRVIRQLAASNKRIVELIASNAQRLDQNDQEHRKFVEFQDESRRLHYEFQRESQRRHEEIVAELNRILQRLTGNNQKPN